MKKKLLGMVVVAVVAIVAGYNVYISQNETKLSDLVLANVEAFAWGGETSGSYYLHPCPYSMLAQSVVQRNMTKVTDVQN